MFRVSDSINYIGAMFGSRQVRQCTKRVEQQSRILAAKSDEEIRQACEALIHTPKLGSLRPGHHGDLYRLLGYEIDAEDSGMLALAAEVFTRSPPHGLRPGVRLYDEQLTAAIQLVRGSLVQMDTGEGKTFAIMIAALTLLRRHENVVILTANPYLAARDAVQCSSFWAFLRVGVGLVLPAAYSATGWPSWEATVVYATPEEYIFQHMSDDLAALDKDRRARGGAVLLDEADAVLLEKLSGTFDQTRWVAPAVKDWSLPCRVAEQLVPGHVERVFGTLQVALTESGEAETARICGSDLPESTRLVVLRDVELAYSALHVAVEGHDYRIAGDTVLPIDSASGWPNPYKVPDWVAPLEQHRRLRRRPLATRMNITNAMGILRDSAHLAGTSGTIINESIEYLLLLNLPTVAIRPRRPRQQQNIPDQTFYDADTAHRYVVEVALEEAPNGPVFIVSGSTGDAEKLAAALTAGAPPDVDVRYAAAETMAGERMFEGAGEAGVIVVSTRAAGRGVDIQLSAASRAAGGTLLIMLGHAEQARIDRQVLGRVGRSGDPYTAFFINHLDDPIMRQLRIASAFRDVIRRSGTAGLGNKKMMSRSLMQFQRGQRWTQLAQFATAVECGRADAQAYSFLHRWFREVQHDGSVDHCGPAFATALSRNLAERLVPQLGDGTLQATQAQTIEARASGLIGVSAADATLEVRLIDQPRPAAIKEVEDALRGPLLMALAANESSHDRRPVYDRVEQYLDRMIVDVVETALERVLDDEGPSGSVPVGLGRIAVLLDVDPACRDLERPPGGWDAEQRAALRSALIADGRAAYASRRDEIERLVGELGGMRQLGWQALDQVLGEARRTEFSQEAYRSLAEDVLHHVLHDRVGAAEGSGSGGTGPPAAEPVDGGSALPLDGPELFRSVVRLTDRRTSRRVVTETISGAADDYWTASRRADLALWLRQLPPMRHQYAYAAEKAKLAAWSEQKMLEDIYTNLLSSADSRSLDALFRVSNSLVSFRIPQLSVPARVSPSAAGRVLARHEVPTDSNKLILYFTEGLKVRMGKRAPKRERVVAALRYLLDENPIDTLGDPERVQVALASWMRSARRAEIPVWRRGPVDGAVRGFLDFLHQRGRAAPRPRGFVAAGRATTRRLAGRVANPRFLLTVVAAVATAALAGALAVVDLGVRPELGFLGGLLDGVLAAGSLDPGRAFGYAVLPTTATAVVMWLLRDVNTPRGAFAGERLIFVGFLAGVAVWIFLRPPVPGAFLPVGVVLAILIVGAFLLRNLIWIVENTAQVRLIAGFVAVSAAVAAAPLLADRAGSGVPLAVFSGVAVTLLATHHVRRGHVEVNTLVVSDAPVGEVLPSRRRLNARVGWQAAVCAFAASWLVGQFAGAASVSAAGVVEVVAYLGVVLLFLWRTSLSVTDLHAWRKLLRTANQSFRGSAGTPDLEARLRALRGRLLVVEMTLVVLCVVVAVAVTSAPGGSTGGARFSPETGLAAVTLAVLCCDLGRVFVRSVGNLSAPAGTAMSEAGDDDRGDDLASSVQDVVQRLTKRLLPVVLLYGVFDWVSGVLGVYDVASEFWHWLLGLLGYP